MTFAWDEIEQSIGQRFAGQVRRYRERPAILTESGFVTYGELDILSNRIAHALLSSEVAPGDTVGVLVEQGIAQIAAILGVLKSGGIYVPLDVALPRQRLGEILVDADPGVIVTDRINRSLARLTGGERRRVLDVTADLGEQPDDFPLKSVGPDAFAYIYYTSGSTGAAKGVVDNHRNVLHNIARYTNNLSITSKDRLTLLQSCGFSGAVSNIFTALLNGATLLPFDVRSRGVVALAKWLGEQRPTIFHSVPSLFRQVVDTGVVLPSLRIVRLEGDLARAVDVDFFNRHFDSRCVLVNGLGATETGISAQYFIEHGTALSGPIVPVGHVTAGMSIDIVDASGQTVPPGEFGEIVVTSRHLACGYWRRPDLTGSLFTHNSTGSRSYRTRDLGRIDARGRLCCHGRIDLLVKIRGEWVDLGVLEEMLTGCAGVIDAIALTAQEDDGNTRVTACLVVDSREDTSPDRLRDALRNRGLAQVVMPARFKTMDQWPLDLNGKVDRTALAAMTDSFTPVVPPVTEAEQQIAKAFSRVLDLPVLSVTDDFFELGGDSLKAVEVALELGRLKGSDLAFGAFQHASSVQALARIYVGTADQGSLVPLQPRGTGQVLFCVHAHMGHVFNLRELAQQFAPDRPFYGLQAQGLSGVERPVKSVEAMATDYVASIRTLQPRGPYLLAGYCFGSWVAVEMARQLQDSGEGVGALFLIAPDRPPGFEVAAVPSDARQYWIRLWSRLRESTFSELANAVWGRFASAIDRTRVRLLWQASQWWSTSRWPLEQAFRQPADAIAIMATGYRPDAYRGDATILLPDGVPTGESEQRAWDQFATGTVELVAMAGDPSDLLRQPYVRDVAACIALKIQQHSGHSK